MTREWTQIGTHTLQRELRGVESIVNHSERTNDGNYQLTFAGEFETNLSEDELRRRLDTTWFLLRQKIPLLGVETEDPKNGVGVVFINALRTFEEAKAWIDRTTSVVQDGRTVKQVFGQCINTNLDTKNRLPKLFLVLTPTHGRIGMVLQSSHALTGHYSLGILEAFFAQLVKEESEQSLQHAFHPENLEKFIPRLPSSLSFVYRRLYEPTEEQIQEQILKALSREIPPEENCVGLELRAGAPHMTPRMHSDISSLDATETRFLLQKVKKLGFSPTTAVFASIVSAMQQMRSKPTPATWAPLHFSTHSSRWIPTNGNKEFAPVTMAIVPSIIGVDLSNFANADFRDDATICKVAQAITKEQQQYLSSPHLMGIADVLAETLPKEDAGCESMPDALCKQAPATLTSQGSVALSERHEKGRTWINVPNAYYGGRNTDPSVCFALYTFRGKLCTVAIYDEKYFESEKVERLQSIVMHNLRRFGDSQISRQISRL